MWPQLTQYPHWALAYEILAKALHSSEPQIWHQQSQDNNDDFHGENSSDLLLKITMEGHILFVIAVVITIITPMQTRHLYELLTYR